MTIPLKCPRCLLVVDLDVDKDWECNEEGKKAVRAEEACPDCSEQGCFQIYIFIMNRDLIIIGLICVSVDLLIMLAAWWFDLNIGITYVETFVVIATLIFFTVIIIKEKI